MWASTPLQPGDGLVAHSEQRCETREEADKPASDLGLWASEPTTRHEEMLLRRDQVLDGYAASAIIRYPGEQTARVVSLRKITTTPPETAWSLEQSHRH